ncbi:MULTISPECIES: helix-turn-helix transcriptional regulator [unclassified Saccharopolyspora]|uniref:helix-turn-helix domain-containing protein n=1 Tax=unclassified Saccharopolyspora TaxID=2646250 RepID=UPI001CD3180F|nr:MULTISPECIES: helix-turn-helix transcriptional regulator [unclassified Saccharopolyspora]MCA1188330.1 helix-turn-helix domain-containing protein [Saccharopolyspora sp. 6T]MCA1225339.1 helix-turn-helix domain-containing protein [Saccharopolyspora sp. 6M]MCA1278869.1 helix-turn-helix domain-containing protein [Saccharopolyspora sp. 7B]
MGSTRATIGRRQLGAELRDLRIAAGLSQKDAAEVIESDTSLISRLERGQRSIKMMELDALLRHYGAPADRRAQIAELAKAARQRLPRRTYSDNLPGAFRRLSDHEQDAAEICYSDSELIPGLLQTEDYIRAMMRLNRPDVFKNSEDDVDARVEFRLQRQQLLRKPDHPWIWFVIGEAAIRRPVGGKDVQRQQLLHLVEVIEQNSRVTVQVAPLAAADHPLLGSNLEILKFGGLAADIVHQPTFIGGGVYLTEDRDVRECTRLFDRLRAVALGPDDTRAFIAEHAKELEDDR